jgi:hypothetical protein
VSRARSLFYRSTLYTTRDNYSLARAVSGTLYVCIDVCMYAYVYTYTYVEREREGEGGGERRERERESERASERARERESSECDRTCTTESCAPIPTPNTACLRRVCENSTTGQQTRYPQGLAARQQRSRDLLGGAAGVSVFVLFC